MPDVYKCSRCSTFETLVLRSLYNHYQTVHGNELNLNIVCGVGNCPASFTKCNTFYKHLLKHHLEAYNERPLSRKRHLDVDNEEFEPDDHRDDIDDHHHERPSCHSSDIDGDDDTDIERDSEIGSEDGNALMEQQHQKENNIDIKRSAASFALKVKERSKIPQTSMNTIIDSTTCLVQQVLASVKTQLLVDLAPCTDEIHSLINKAFTNAEYPFSGIETESSHAAYIKENFNYVDYVEICLGKRLVRKKSGAKRIISEKDETFIYIPILKSIQQMLSNKRIAGIVLKEPTQCEDGLFYDVCDGNLYRSDEYFQNHKDALMLVLYHDELEVCNPLSSNAGTHKVDMFYYTLANLSPKFRSKHCAVRLLAIANAKLVKKYGIEDILQPIIDDLIELYNGVTMNVGEMEKVVFGKVVFCTGDTLGQHLWAGFKEGVGFAFQKCRSCYCTYENMQDFFEEEAFPQRTLMQYNRECAAIENARTSMVQNDLKTTYGINKRSALCQLPEFDVTKQLPQDIMHTLLEGAVQYEVRLVLLFFIESRVISLQQLNSAITNHCYGYSEVSDKPGPLKESVFVGDESYKLKYNAAQTRLFLRILPYLLSPMVDTNDEHFIFLVCLLEIVNLVFAPVISLQRIQYLSLLIKEHLGKFRELFPEKNILPKQHYMLHIPSMIKHFGPLIRSSCFNFESAHKYFKELARKQNFKNLPLSLAKRHQFFECSSFGDALESPSSYPLFSTERKFGVVCATTVSELSNLQQKFQSCGLLPGIHIETAHRASWIILNGTKYSKGALIAIGVIGNPPLPEFGQLSQIWLIDDFVYFEVLLFATGCFDDLYQAYSVTFVPDVVRVVPYESLVDFNVFHMKTDKCEKCFVPTKYYIVDIMHAYEQGNSPMNN